MVRVGFIGAGHMAGHHWQALRQVPTRHTVVGVADVSSATAAAFARRTNAPAFATIAELLEQRPDVVHICTPAGAHFEPARQALLAGAHVYVEKPFVETPAEAETLFTLARERGLLIGAGHQLLRDPAIQRLMQGAAELKPITLVESWFAFRPPRLDPYRSAARALGEQLVDVLPHPLYSLVAALERFGPTGAPLEIINVTATPTALHALLRTGEVTGRLSISLRARPVASTLTVAGANGSLTTDLVRGIVLGAANEGTSPVEKIVNPFLEASQLAWRSAASLTRRLRRGAAYPGLVEMLTEFYSAAAAGARSPVSVDHLQRVTAVYEQLAANIRSAVTAAARPAVSAGARPDGPLAVVTGAAGFFGRAITRELARRGFRIRGIGRSERPDDPHVHEWVRADLGQPIAAGTLHGATVVVHAAAETAGGFDAHERNTVGATRHLLAAMAAAEIHRLVHISSISVLRPPRLFWERQTESTPRASSPERLGPYTWGKCAAEELVAAAQARGEIHARIVRPAALLDWQHIELPGLMGRRLFGHWHLGLGYPGLPFALCEVGEAGAAVAWCAEHFAEAPPIVNLLDPAIRTRGQALRRFRQHDWRGRVVWVPISLLAGAVGLVRLVASLGRREPTPRVAVWSILRPRRYDPAVATTVLTAAGKDTSPQPVVVSSDLGPSREPAYG